MLYYAYGFRNIIISLFKSTTLFHGTDNIMQNTLHVQCDMMIFNALSWTKLNYGSGLIGRNVRWDVSLLCSSSQCIISFLQDGASHF